MAELKIELEDLIWQSDWNGYEVGYDDVGVVGFYMQYRDDGTYYFYIDVETDTVLELWKEQEDEDEC